MDDIIYRQDALSELRDWREACVESGHRESASDLKDVIRAFEELPSAQPERKKGRWIDIDAETYTWKIRCDQCGHERSMLSTGQMYPRFCENCGADMRGDHYEG